MRRPGYDVGEGVECVPPNELAKIRQPYEHYVVVGAGKTGMDACLWLLGRGVAPAEVSWVMPRDSWMLDRARVQPGQQFHDR